MVLHHSSVRKLAHKLTINGFFHRTMYAVIPSWFLVSVPFYCLDLYLKNQYTSYRTQLYMNEILYNEQSRMPISTKAGFHEISDPLVCIGKGDLEESISIRGDLILSFSLASLSLDSHISMCANQLWLVTRNVYVLNNVYVLSIYLNNIVYLSRKC